MVNILVPSGTLLPQLTSSIGPSLLPTAQPTASTVIISNSDSLPILLACLAGLGCSDPNSVVTLSALEMYTTHTLDLTRNPTKTIFTDADDIKIRGATMMSTILPVATTHTCTVSDFTKVFTNLLNNRMTTNTQGPNFGNPFPNAANEPRSHLITTITAANGSKVNVIEIYAPPALSSNHRTSVYTYEDSCLQKSTFVLHKCLKIIHSNVTKPSPDVLPWREDKLTKLTLALASTTVTTVVTGKREEAKYWEALKQTSRPGVSTKGVTTKGMANKGVTTKPQATKRSRDLPGKPEAPAPSAPAAKKAKASSSSFVFNHLTPTSGNMARSLIKTGRAREQSGHLGSAVKHYKAANNRFLPNYPKLETKIRKLEEKMGEEGDGDVDAILGTPGAARGAARDEQAFRGIMGSPPLRMKVLEQEEEEEEEEQPVAKKLASTPLKGTPARVPAAEVEEEEEAPTRALASTPLKGGAVRAPAAEVKKMPVVQRLASTPLKGTPARVPACEVEEEKEAPTRTLASTPLKGGAVRAPAAEVEKTPVVQRLASTPLKGTPARVPACEVQEEKEDAPIRKLAATPLRGAPVRAPTADIEDAIKDKKQPTAKLASTPLKGAVARVSASEMAKVIKDEAMPTTKLAAKPLKGAATRVLAEPVAKSLVSTPPKGLAVRAPAADVEEALLDEKVRLKLRHSIMYVCSPGRAQETPAALYIDTNVGTPRRRSLLVSTPLKGTPARVTQLENILGYAETLTNSEENSEMPVLLSPQKPAPAPPTPSPPKSMDLVTLLNSGSEEQVRKQRERIARGNSE